MPVEFSYVQIYGPGCGELITLPELLFSERCNFCDTWKKKRQNISVEISANPQPFLSVLDLGPIFSAEFLSLLKPEEREGLNCEAVSISGSNEQFFEIVGPPVAKTVKAKTFPGFEGFVCPKCGYSQFSYYFDYQMYLFVAKKDIPEPRPSCFLVDERSVLTFCISKKRWDAIKNDPICEELLADPIGFIDEAEADRNPELPILKKPRKLPRNVDEHCPPKDKRIDEAY